MTSLIVDRIRRFTSNSTCQQSNVLFQQFHQFDKSLSIVKFISRTSLRKFVSTITSRHIFVYVYSSIYQSIWRLNQLSTSSKSTLLILIIKSWRIDATYLFRIRICLVDQTYQANSTKSRHHSNNHKFIFRLSKSCQINISALFVELWKSFIIWKTILTSWLHFSVEALSFLFFNCKISLIR